MLDTVCSINDLIEFSFFADTLDQTSQGSKCQSNKILGSRITDQRVKPLSCGSSPFDGCHGHCFYSE